jgi:glycosyltransferase involved in cell wall biosynthesis
MQKISCVICAYNEEHRIRTILSAVVDHPLLAEVIVVNDGSTDETHALLTSYGDKITLISYPDNRGKTHALTLGIAAATGDLLMTLDADLKGITSAHISALAEPVLTGRAEVSLSLRANSLSVYRMLGIDFVSGERVIPRILVAGLIDRMRKLPRFGCESFINRQIIKKRLSISIVHWENVFNVRMYEKIGWRRGFQAEAGMIIDVFTVLNPLEVIWMHVRMLQLMRRATPLPISPLLAQSGASKDSV